ncbi:MAG: AAA family ATPase [Desulfobacterales bacterium]|nr:AAA family ATPase [Desulfobacterales bacterium]
MVKAHELKDSVTGFQTITKRKISSALVGRDGELNKLKHHISKVIEGEGSIINLMGESGIGKSRLIEELKKQNTIKKVALLEGRAVAFGKNLSFHPIIHTFKNWAKISENDPPVESVRKLKNSIWGVCLHETPEIFPFVATLMGLRLSGEHLDKIKDIEGEALEKLIFNSIRKLLIKSSQTIPLVFILEDMHWADTSSIEFTEFLMDLVEHNRICFINIFRPGYIETSERFIKKACELYPTIYSPISLHPLNRNHTEELVGNLIDIKDLSPSIREKILDKANGNPFFTEEIIRSIIDVKTGFSKNNVLRKTSKFNELIIPQTINDVLMARIDRLDEKTKNLITVASVIGRNFFYRILVDIIHPKEDIDKNLSFLKEAQLIFERNRMGEREYLFKHALTQEVVYESILDQKRHDLHLRVAGSIEHLFNDKLYEFYGVLAYHYGMGKNLEKTEDYLLRAGKESLKSSASNEALTYFQEALNLYLNKYGDQADPEKIAMFEQNIGLAYYNKGLFVKALEHFDIFLDRYGQGSPKNNFHKLLKFLFDMFFFVLKLYIPSIQSKRKPTKTENTIFEIFQKRGITLIYLDTKRFFVENISFIKKLTSFDIKHVDTGVYSYCSSSGIFALTGISFNISKRLIQRAEPLIDKNNSKEFLCYKLYHFFYNLVSGNWSECKEYDEELVNLNLDKGRTWLAATYVSLQGMLKVEQGHFAQAQMLANKLKEIWNVFKYQNANGLHYSLKIRLFFKQRRIQEVTEALTTGIAFQKKCFEELRLSYFLGIKAYIDLLDNKHSDAEISLSQAKEISTSKGRVIPLYISSYFLSRFLFDLNTLERSLLSDDNLNIIKCKTKAFLSAKKALKTANRFAPDKVEVFKQMGSYFWMINKQKKALKWWSQSLAEAEKMGALPELYRNYFEVGQRLFEAKSNFKDLSSIKRKAFLLKAKTGFKSLNLKYDLEKLEQFVALSNIDL